MTKSKTLEQLRAEKERAETQLAQEQHKLERLENRKKYLEKGERTKRTHRLCNLGGTVESLAPEIKDLTRTEMTELMEHIFSLSEVQRAVRHMAITHISQANREKELKQKWETYETKAEAKRRKKEIEYKKEMGSFVVRKCKTLDELITEYVALYGKENWALSTYEGNVSLINNYILPIIGDTKLSEINTRFIERYYQSLLKRRAVINPLNKTSRNEFVSSSTVRDINKLLRNCFEQAVKWELMEKNPCTHATVPKHKSQKRDIWTADTLMYALSVCEDERLKLAINLSFSCSLRLGELLGLTWDCVDISPEAIEENRAYVFINKESQRIRKESLNALDEVDPELLAKVLANPEMRALLNSLAKTMK